MSEKDEPSVDLARTAVVAADTRLPETYLVVIEGELAGRRFRLHKPRMVIGAAGRGADNDIDIELATLSARHAAVELSRDGTVRLWDLRSSNGTYLNDEPIDASGGGLRVKSGDTISLGPDLTFALQHPGDESQTGSVGAGRKALGDEQRPGRRGRRRAQKTAVHSSPPGISSDVPLGKVLGYLVSGGIVVCTLFGLLNDAFDFVGLVKGVFGGGG
jgi:hypothetical protein